ncbi:GAF domain-containing protein [Microbacterium petrolearium]
MTQPEMTLDEAEAAARDRLGAVLFTVTVILPGHEEISRIHTTHPDVYAVGGRKRLDPSGTSPAWLETVVEGQRPFVGPDRPAVRDFFVDWETIESLGCGSIINTPVVSDGRTIGSINFLAAEGVMTADRVDDALAITGAVTPAVARALAELVEGAQA